MEAKKISVIIPTYNRKEKLPACVDSVLAQTYLFFVVLVLAYCGGGLLPDVLLPKVIQQIRPYLPGTYVMQIFCHALY